MGIHSRDRWHFATLWRRNFLQNLFFLSSIFWQITSAWLALLAKHCFAGKWRGLRETALSWRGLGKGGRAPAAGLMLRTGINWGHVLGSLPNEALEAWRVVLRKTDIFNFIGDRFWYIWGERTNFKYIVFRWNLLKASKRVKNKFLLRQSKLI